MTVSDEPVPTSDPAAPAVEPASSPASELAEGGAAAMVDMGAAAADAARATAESVEAIGTAGAETMASVADTNARAFDEARTRLRTMTGSVASGKLFEPFQFSPDILRGKAGADYVRASQIMAEFNTRALDAWRANAESAFAHWQHLAGVKSVSEAITLNTEFARKQMEAFSAQSRELATIAGRITSNEP